MKHVLCQKLLALWILGVSLCLAVAPPAEANLLAERATPTIENGDFEQGPLRPAWSPAATNAGIALVKQPGKPSNHVVRVTPHYNPCSCEDDQCPEVSLTGTMINLVPGSKYSITWNFMYVVNLSGERVSFYASGDKCNQEICQSAVFNNVRYPTTVKANKWYTYSASFEAVSSATDGRMSLSLDPGGCSTAALYMDNFRLFGPF